MIKTNVSQKVAVVALFVVLTFAVTGLSVVTLLSQSFVVAQVAQERPRERIDPISDCFETEHDTTTRKLTAATNATTTTNATTVEVGTGDIQNWTESVQNFVSLIPASNNLTLVNEDVAGGSGPITDMHGIWNLLTNGNMTAHDRQIVLTEVNSLLAAAQPGFTQIQQDALSRCITDATNALPPTPNY